VKHQRAEQSAAPARLDCLRTVPISAQINQFCVACLANRLASASARNGGSGAPELGLAVTIRHILTSLGG
jgi:hypothetical protein